MSEIILGIAFFAVLFLWVITDHAKERKFSREREHWQTERKDLLDRIQAPTFAEYTNKIVKEKKLEQPQEEEPEDPYIS